jgi:hypothetical protein
MNTKEAINRLSYTIGNGNKPNQTDKVAMNSIINFVNKSDADNVHENALFAKLYTLILSDFLEHYKDIDFANKVLNVELSRPLEFHVRVLLQRLNSLDLTNFFKSKGIVDTLIINQPDWMERYQANKHLFPAISTNELLEASENWDFDNLVAHLNRNINESLITYKNV